MIDDNDIQHRLKQWDKSLKPSQRNPDAQETFDGLIGRAAKPVPEVQGTPQPNGGYSGKRTRPHTAGDVSD